MRHSILLLTCLALPAQETRSGFAEKRETKVLEDGPNGRIVEETILRKDSQGHALPPEKVRTVERKTSSGSTVVETTQFTADFNGNLQPAQRSVVETSKQGASTLSNTVIERPNINGGFDPIEKSVSQTTATDGKEQTNTSIFRSDGSGKLIEAVRLVSEKVPEGKSTKETVTEYQNASTGKLELSQQKVIVQVPNADGSTSKEITIYGMVAPGRTADGKLHVREQQLVVTTPLPNDTVKESFSVRRPGVTEEKLGAYQKISERVLPIEKAKP